jgi:branched-chain amino acid transport system permease protein
VTGRVGPAILTAAVLFFALLPLFADAYQVSFFLLMFMYLTLAGSWNIITGYAGYLALGHAAFFGLGAYTSAILATSFGVPWPLGALAGGVSAAGCAAIMGGICLRLRHIFFAIATLAFSEAIRVIVLSWDKVTGGGFGISIPPRAYLAPFYYGMFACAVATVAMTYLLARSDFGLRLLAIREDEDAAETVGVDTTRAKIIAFVLSSVLCGVAGGVYAPYITYVEPISVFSLLITTQLIVMAIFGGTGTVWGPVVGVAVLGTLQEVFWANFPYFHRVLFGALIMVTILFMPQGLIELLKRRGVLPRSRSV